MNSQEAQQAEAIKKIKERREDGKQHYRRENFREVWEAKENQQDEQDFDYVLRLVDSQAQKIAQLTKERDEMTATAYRLGSEAQQHISEARKIAEKMRDASERPGGGHTFLPWERKP